MYIPRWEMHFPVNRSEKSETFFSFGGYRVTFIDKMSQWQIAAIPSSSCSLDSMHFRANAEKVVKVIPNNESGFIFISASSSTVVFMICCAVRRIYTRVFIICTIIETGLPGIIIYRFEWVDLACCCSLWIYSYPSDYVLKGVTCGKNGSKEPVSSWQIIRKLIYYRETVQRTIRSNNRVYSFACIRYTVN